MPPLYAQRRGHAERVTHDGATLYADACRCQRWRHTYLSDAAAAIEIFFIIFLFATLPPAPPSRYAAFAVSAMMPLDFIYAADV